MINNCYILVVEDNDVNLAMILDMLNMHSHQVAVARNGLEALEIAHSYKPELILMDLRMPLMGGLEATRKLRDQDEFSSLPIIALTASADGDTVEHCLKSGFTAHLAKPVQSKELFKYLQYYLQTDNQA